MTGERRARIIRKRGNARGGGLYWLAAAVILCFVGGVTNAWLFLVRLPERS